VGINMVEVDETDFRFAATTASVTAISTLETFSKQQFGRSLEFRCIEYESSQQRNVSTTYQLICNSNSAVYRSDISDVFVTSFTAESCGP
jgi:hypothetical protein